MYLHHGKYKFARKELWSLDMALAKVIHDGLVQFKAMKRMGLPGQVVIEVNKKHDDDSIDLKYEKETTDLWEHYLDEMIFTFYEIYTDYENRPFTVEFHKFYEEKKGKVYDIEDDKFIPHFECSDEVKKRDKEYSNRIDNGLKLFSEYFQGLWD